jgi:hypothetical protein
MATVNATQNIKNAKNKKKGRELATDIANGWEQKRILNKKAMQEIEVSRMRKIADIYQREINHEIPAHLELIKKHYEALGIKGFAYYKSKIKVQEGDFEKKKWLNLMKDADGFFKYEAEQIIKIVCQFQVIKKSRVVGAGYNTDPENLFCEEIKTWASATLCILDCSLNTKAHVDKRCRYLEEVLCEDGLFDRPSSLITHTIQQVIVACRGVLRYRTIPIIDRELAHHDARRAFDSVKKHLVMLMADSLDFCSNVFRTSKSKVVNDQDRVGQIIGAIMSSENIAIAFPNDQAEIRERIYAPGQAGPLLKPRSVLVLGTKTDLLLAQQYVPQVKLPKDTQLEIKNSLVKLTDTHLQHLFTGSDSGLEEKFRGNAQVARHYLKLLALVLEIGDFYHVIDKAAACASQGGTLLVYGLANTQLNIMLETCDHLMSSLREACSTLARVAELRFEELVFQNNATVKRNPWILYYRTIHSTLARIDKTLATICQETALIKVKANSLTLYEMFQKASQDTTEFLNAATDFANHMSAVLGITYSPPQQQQVVSLPDIKELKGLCGGTVNPQALSTKHSQMLLALTDKEEIPPPVFISKENEKEKILMPFSADREKERSFAPERDRSASVAYPEREKERMMDPSYNNDTPPRERPNQKREDLSFNDIKRKKRRSIFSKVPRMSKSLMPKKEKGNADDSDRSYNTDKEEDFSVSLNNSPEGSRRNSLVVPPNRNGISTSNRNSVNVANARVTKAQLEEPNPFDDESDSLFNLTNQISSISKSGAEFIMDNQRLNSSHIPMIKSKITLDIVKIDLSRNRLQGFDITELCKHLEAGTIKVLTTLILSENDIGDEGAKSLGYYLVEPACRLQELSVGYNGITDKGGMELAQSLSENTSLEILNMDCNSFSDLTLIELERSLSKPKCPVYSISLAELQNHRKFTKSGAKLLWKAMSSRPQLAIIGDPPFTFKESILNDSAKKRGGRKDMKLTPAEEANIFHIIANESLSRTKERPYN